MEESGGESGARLEERGGRGERGARLEGEGRGELDWRERERGARLEGEGKGS